MKLSNHLSLALFFVASLFLVTLSTSCANEGCTNPFSDNFDADADEDDGTCILSREKFIGQYVVSETCPSGNYNFNINIVASSGSENGIIINNLGEFGAAFNGTVDKSSVTIPSQSVSAQGLTLNVNGSGTISDNSLIINYTYDVGGQGESCTMNCTKQ